METVPTPRPFGSERSDSWPSGPCHSMVFGREGPMFDRRSFPVRYGASEGFHQANHPKQGPGMRARAYRRFRPPCCSVLPSSRDSGAAAIFLQRSLRSPGPLPLAHVHLLDVMVRSHAFHAPFLFPPCCTEATSTVRIDVPIRTRMVSFWGRDETPFVRVGPVGSTALPPEAGNRTGEERGVRMPGMGFLGERRGEGSHRVPPPPRSPSFPSPRASVLPPTRWIEPAPFPVEGGGSFFLPFPVKKGFPLPFPSLPLQKETEK